MFILSESISSGDRFGLLAEILFFGLPRPSLGKQGATRVWWLFGSCARRVVVVDRAVVVGHGQTTSRLIRSRSIEQGVSHRFRACLIYIKWKKREKFSLRHSAFPDWCVLP